MMEPMDVPANYDALRPVVEHESFDHRAVPQLEEYVNEQVNTLTYDFEANKALLKLYSFFPDMVQPEVIAKVVALAVMNMPGPGVTAVSYLLPKDLAQREPLASLSQASDALEGARFGDFWALCNGSEGLAALIKGIPGFKQHARRFIVTSLSNTFQSTTREIMEIALDLRGAELDKYAGQNSAIKSMEGGMCFFVLNSHNQSQPRKFKESLEFEKVLDVVNKLNAK